MKLVKALLSALKRKVSKSFSKGGTSHPSIRYKPVVKVSTGMPFDCSRLKEKNEFAPATIDSVGT